jgi:hypothetical protein
MRCGTFGVEFAELFTTYLQKNKKVRRAERGATHSILDSPTRIEDMNSHEPSTRRQEVTIDDPTGVIHCGPGPSS